MTVASLPYFDLSMSLDTDWKGKNRDVDQFDASQPMTPIWYQQIPKSHWVDLTYDCDSEVFSSSDPSLTSARNKKIYVPFLQLK